ncbi:MAG TPA: ACP S-malonyltransferase [Actinomycetota bacterium]|nr:ACP S-malonyltransferase [Actinomycetota bacterium]
MRAGLFPGQGIRAKTVLESLPKSHALLASASELLGYDLFKRVEVAARRKGATLPTAVAQPAIFVAGMISFSYDSAGWDFFCGHSLGEYTALTAAGTFGFEDALGIIRIRAEGMERAGRVAPGSMAAVLGLDLEKVSDIAQRTGVVVANDNSPGQVVLAAPEPALAAAAAEVRAAGARSVLLDVSGAFHTDAMGSAGPALARALEEAEIRTPEVPVVSNVLARPYTDAAEIKELLVAQLTRPVRFRESIEWLVEQDVEDFTDFGPGRVVAGLAQRCRRAARSTEVAAHA